MSLRRKRELKTPEDEDARTLSEQEFKRKFKDLFDLDSDLTADSCYMILTCTGFDLEKTKNVIVQGRKPVKQYSLPAFLFRSASTSSTSIRNQSQSPKILTPSSSFGKIVEGSDDSLDERSPKRKRILHSRMRAKSRSPLREDKDEGQDSLRTLAASASDSDFDDDAYADSDKEEDTVDWIFTANRKQVIPIPRKAPTTPTRRKNLDDAVLEHRTTTKVTPWLYILASEFYGDKLEEIKDNSALPKKEDPVAFLENLKQVAFEQKDEDSQSITFNSSVVWRDQQRGRKGYASVDINGMTYKPGDYILVRGNVDGTTQNKQKRNGRHQAPLEASINEDAWFARIEYLFEDEDGDKMAHFQWFEHGTRTSIGELSSCQELFLLTWCNDEALTCVLKKIYVDRLSPHENKSTSLAEVEIAKGLFFYRFHYNPDTFQFTDASLHEKDPGQTLDEGRTCSSCEVTEEKSRACEVRLLGKIEHQGPEQFIKGVCFKGFSFGNVDYFLYDFVYIVEPGAKVQKPYIICQITSISTKNKSRRYKEIGAMIKPKKLKIKVNIFERYDTLQNSTWFEEATSGRRHSIRDNKRLYRTGKSMKIQLEDLEGKCHVRHQNHIANMDLYKEQKNTFWLKEEVKRGIDPHGVIRREDLCLLRPEHIQYSAQSEEEIAFKREIEADFSENGTKLRAMEIFAGAGLMTAGLIAAFKGSLDFVSAVEFSPAACHTHSVNFPSCQVHCADGSVLLERAIRREQGEKLQPLRINDKVIPDLPRPGEIDFICGGPPCPGFSGMNRFKRSDDIKNSLIVLFLAYLDFYKPKYFLLENVAELLHSKLSATQITKHRMEGGIEQGMVKLILRACTSLGYQVQQAVLQAAEHNVPQNRQRVFFWASKIGWPLPKYPEVENLVHSTRYSTRNRWQNERRSAPQNIVTIGDAISDLPAFDWINPHGDYPICSQIEQEERRNRIEQYEIKKELGYVGRNEQSYASQPLSEFQRSMRNGVALTGLTNHVNEILNPEDIRRVCAVPLLPGCDHRDIPDENIKQGCLRKSNKSAVRPNYYDGRFGRLDMEDIFRTCVTTLHPLSKPGAVLHPTQHRVIAIREFARAMSLHDTFTFDLDSFRMKDVIRQIGNGAPTNLVKAVGMPLFEVLVEKHQREKTTKSATVSRERLKTKHLQQSMENSRGSRMGSSSQNAIEIIDSDDDEDDLSV